VSATPQDDYQALVDYCVGFAQTMLRETAGFLPFGAKIGGNGQLGAVGADAGEEHPPPADLVRLLADGFRRDAADGAIRACCLCMDATHTLPSGEKTDAIVCGLEHRDVVPMRLIVPYRISNGVAEIAGEIHRADMVPAIFPTGPYAS
jgi:hypothetical protein